MEQYLAEDRRIEDQIQRVDSQLTKVQQQIADLREAIVDEQGIRQFCEQAAHNFDNMDDAKWRVLLERVRLKVVVPPSKQPVAYVALPTVKEPVREIALETSQCYSPQSLKVGKQAFTLYANIKSVTLAANALDRAFTSVAL